MLLLLAWACGSATEGRSAIDPWPDDPKALLTICEAEPVAEIAVSCRLRAARGLGELGDAEGVQRACSAVDDPTWAAECHFLSAEGAAVEGRLALALEQCDRAGRFVKDCARHVGWKLPPVQGPGQAGTEAEFRTLGDDLQTQVDRAMADQPSTVRRAALASLHTWVGNTTYVGSGTANPAAAHLQGPLGPALHTGFAFEAARLLAHRTGKVPTLADIAAIWDGTSPPPTGSPDPAPVGCFGTAAERQGPAASVRIPTWGASTRVVSQDPREDLAVASLHALVWTGLARAEDLAVTDDGGMIARTARQLTESLAARPGGPGGGLTCVARGETSRPRPGA